jgi:hypothetical protein
MRAHNFATSVRETDIAKAGACEMMMAARTRPSGSRQLRSKRDPQGGKPQDIPEGPPCHGGTAVLRSQ